MDVQDPKQMTSDIADLTPLPPSAVSTQQHEQQEVTQKQHLVHSLRLNPRTELLEVSVTGPSLDDQFITVNENQLDLVWYSFWLYSYTV